MSTKHKAKPNTQISDPAQFCRLAIRLEGTFVNAYFAQPGTMDKAFLIGSILHAIVSEDAAIFERWKELMFACLQSIIKNSTGLEASFGGEQVAPEHERAGRA